MPELASPLADGTATARSLLPTMLRGNDIMNVPHIRRAPAPAHISSSYKNGTSVSSDRLAPLTRRGASSRPLCST